MKPEIFSVRVAHSLKISGSFSNVSRVLRSLFRFLYNHYRIISLINQMSKSKKEDPTHYQKSLQNCGSESGVILLFLNESKS